MKEIIIIAFGSAKENYDQRISLLGSQFRIKRLGVDFHFNLALELVKKYRTQCDILALSGFPTDVRIKNKIHTHHQTLKLREAAQTTPITDGSNLKLLAVPLFLKSLSQREPNLFNGKQISFFSGIVQWDYLSAYEEIGPDLIFGDLYFALGLPKSIRGLQPFREMISRSAPVLKRLNLEKLKEKDFTKPITKSPTMKDFFDSDIFVINETQMEYVKLPDLSGKTVIIDQIDNFSRRQLDLANAEKVYSCFPDFIGMPHLGFCGLEAILMAHTGKRKLDQEDVLDIIAKAKINPEIYIPKSQNTKTVEKFSFIIHPLSKSQLFEIPIIKPLLGTKIAASIEDLMKHSPGFHYGKITGIKSEFNGKEVEGDLFALPMTPKVMMKQNPEKVYEALGKICVDAYKKGSKIIGLGAYTKIVGDAGVTVNERSPIPVTTGNSLSASATLWAASFGIEKMQLVKRKDKIYLGTCMVVGATGSIGKACSKILTRQWKTIIVSAPRPYKVLELVRELRALNPDAEVIGTSNPDKYSSQCDLIITSTSAQGEKVLDIMNVKPGCVICDVSRPFDISLEDAAKRPDVLVIASGEVTLPGDVRMAKGIGLPGNTVYACLAETALLAMEGRHESFSLSRELTYENVCEIDQLARKHGIRLAAIMGHAGEITEEEIKLCREHALKSQRHTSVPIPEESTL
jgi:predicted amino acid dehydrogenase